MRILLLATDAYGGHGGIALYCRDLAEALSLRHDVYEVAVIARNMPYTPTDIPSKVRLLATTRLGKLRYTMAVMKEALHESTVIVCGHINLLPLGVLLKLKRRVPVVVVAHGVDAWQRPYLFARQWLKFVDAVWSVSVLTRDRMNAWAGLPETKFRVLPNAVRLERYGMGRKREDLVFRHRLANRKVIMTLARLASCDRYKGIDQVLELMPALIRCEPTLIYLVAGEGDDRPRLMAKARSLGLENHVSFVGFIEEADKADYLSLADVFVMPGRGEGFGFVYLEALACGVPVVGSRVDGSREALIDGVLGELADPEDHRSIAEAIMRALIKPKKIPKQLEYFAWPAFQQRLAVAVSRVVSDLEI